MTETAIPPITRTVDARGSFCPGPLMELIRAISEAEIGDVIAVLSTDRGRRPTSRSGSRRPATGWSACSPATASTRSSS